MKIPPILVIAFNRPELTSRLLEALKQVSPPVLYVAADGPRDHATHPQDRQRCAQTRALLETINWRCTLRTRFQDRNLGCAKGVSDAINWFFDQEPEGLILEDDCIPHPDFFRWGYEMLKKYRNNKSVFCVNGCNLLAPAKCFGDADYAYTNFPLVWGWGSWSRAWKNYRLIPPPFDVAVLQKPGISYHQALAHHHRIQEAVERLDTWDCQWSLTAFQHNGLCPTPRINLVSNIGFGPSATHTLDSESTLSNLATASLPGSLAAPSDIDKNVRAMNRHIATLNYGEASRIWRRYWLRKLLRPFSFRN